MASGTFVISLDFELHWGVSDHRTIDSYRENLSRVPEVVKRSLQLFEERKIHATWATVGMLFCNNKADLFNNISPEHRPAYNDPALSNFLIAEQAGNSETEDPYHFAPSLVKAIANTSYQDLGTHTYSHYYCLEPGQTPSQFYHDLKAARKLLTEAGVHDSVSIVFPRNQYNDQYLEQCAATGFACYRGNYPSWMYAAEAKSTESRMKRAARLIDTYLPLTGARYVQPAKDGSLINVPASCFMRPYSKRLGFLEPLRLRRIKNEMTTAARKKMTYHLWWHPHNFGKDIDRNFENLSVLLDHFEQLQKKYGMQSMNMKEIYEQLTGK